jgi:hypothetical protein
MIRRTCLRRRASARLHWRLVQVTDVGEPIDVALHDRWVRGLANPATRARHRGGGRRLGLASRIRRCRTWSLAGRGLGVPGVWRSGVERSPPTRWFVLARAPGRAASCRKRRSRVGEAGRHRAGDRRPGQPCSVCVARVRGVWQLRRLYAGGRGWRGNPHGWLRWRGVAGIGTPVGVWSPGRVWAACQSRISIRRVAPDLRPCVRCRQRDPPRWPRGES